MSELIKNSNINNFKFKILILCSGKSQLTYEEEKLQFELDVLRSTFPTGEKKFFNKTIGYRNFNGVIKQTEKSRQKTSISNSGKIRSPEAKIRYSMAKLGIPKSEEHREKLRLVNLNKKYSKETNGKKAKGPNGEKLLWWNNGTNQIRSILPPEQSWINGRIPFKKIKI